MNTRSLSSKGYLTYSLECTFKVLYSGFTSNISLLAKGSQHSDLILSLSAALQDESPRIQPLVQKALPLFEQSTNTSTTATFDKDVLKNLVVQLEKLHLFPMEYFNKYQRQHLLLAMVLTERLFCVEGFDFYDRSRLTLLCRSFAFKLIRFRGEVGFLVSLNDVVSCCRIFTWRVLTPMYNLDWRIYLLAMVDQIDRSPVCRRGVKRDRVPVVPKHRQDHSIA